MTEITFEKLYAYGKQVYLGKISLAEAAKKVSHENPEVAESSAEHYINWYSKMREGNYLSWNTNGKLLIYYVNRIIEEEESQVVALAISGARKYAKHRNRQDLDKELVELANTAGVLLPDENSNNEEEQRMQQEDIESTMKNQIQQIEQFIKESGFSYDEGMIKNFFLSLKSKPFVILAGTSGTGKTKLVKLFAEAIGAEYKLVPVRPDWSDSSDLFGHANIHGEFVDGAIVEFVERAMNDLEKPYFLCLDEMNLARVEYYFSDFLSLIETRTWDGKRIVTDTVDLGEAGNSKHANLYIPENLYVIGTVNMDETTYPFSKKVLDRANTIEFSDVYLKPSFVGVTGDAEPDVRGNDFLKTKYITLLTDINASQKELVSDVCTELQAINEELRKANAHVGYRVRDEIVFYMLNNDEFKLLEYKEAMDFEIMQKILPRIQGSSQGIKDLLIELFKKCTGNYSSFEQDTIWPKMEMRLEDKKTVYPKSAKKICYMMRRFEEDGFTSYWL